MKLLWYGESPYIETGAGQVAKHLLPLFQEFFEEIHLVAINQWWQHPNMPSGLSIDQSPLEDLFNPATAKAAIARLDYDVLFLTTDLNRITDLEEEIKLAQAHDKPIIIYAAMDTHIFQPAFWRVMLLADMPIVFSYWCKRQAELVLPALAGRLRTIYHGCEPDVFYPLSANERRSARAQHFGLENDTFLVLNVNRNQIRKDLVRTMAAFHLFHREHPDSVLYLHSKRTDLGGSLPAQAEAMGLRIKGAHPEIIFAPDDYHESAGLTRADLNRIYNAADAFCTTSTGEGWGLTTTEAMAAGVPICAPNNTVFPEQLGLHEERGLLVESGGPDLWACFYGVSDSPRELTSTTGMAAALAHIYYQRDEARQRALRARIWAEQHAWQDVLRQWREALDAIKEGIFAQGNRL